MNNLNATGRPGAGLAERFDLDHAADAAVPTASPASPAPAPASATSPPSPRSPSTSALPARPGLAPPTPLEQLNVDTLSRVIRAGTGARSAQSLRTAASLARLNRSLRATVGETDLLPPIGQLLAESRLALAAAIQPAFETSLLERIAALSPGSQIVMINKLIEQFPEVPAGQPRTLRFDTLLRAAAALTPESAAYAMTRLAACISLLPQQPDCTDRADRFRTLLEHCSTLAAPRVDALCALAPQIGRLPALTGKRTAAIRSLQNQAQALAPADTARLLQALLGPITCVEYANHRSELVDATINALDSRLPAPYVSEVLRAVAGHLNLLTQPEEFTMEQDAAEADAAGVLFDRIRERARSLPAKEQAAVLQTLVPLCGMLPQPVPDGLMTRLRQQVTALPLATRSPILAQLVRLNHPVGVESLAEILADQHLVALDPTRADTITRLRCLPYSQRVSGFMELARGLDETIAPVMRLAKFKETYRACVQLEEPARIEVLTLLASRLALLPAHVAGQMANEIGPIGLQWPSPDRLRLVETLACQLEHFTHADQCAGIELLKLATLAMTPADRAAALIVRGKTFQRIEQEQDRHEFMAVLHSAIMYLQGEQRDAVLPSWISQLSGFTAGSQCSDMLFSIHRETLLYQPDSSAKAAILQALATGLGNFSDACRALVGKEIGYAAHAMTAPLGRPIIMTLDLQQACIETHRQ